MSWTIIVFSSLRVTTAFLVGLMVVVSIATLTSTPVAFVVVTGVALLATFIIQLPDVPKRYVSLINGAGIALLLAVVVGSVLWAILFSSQQGSDFGVYYRCGTELKPTLAANIQACQSAYIGYGDLYWRRSLLSTVPIGLTRAGYVGLKVTNAAFQAAAAVLLWAVLRKCAGPAAMLVGLTLYAFYPDRSFALTLATSDHVTLCLSMLAIAALILAARQSGVPGMLGFGVAGALSVALDLARSTGIFLICATMAVWALYTLPSSGVRRSLLALACFAVGFITTWRIAAFVLDPQGGSDSFLRLASSLRIKPDGNFDDSTYWVHHFWPAIPKGERVGVALRRILQEALWNGAAYPDYLIAKAGMLTSGIGYTWFAAADLSANRDTILTVAEPAVPLWFGGHIALQRACLLPMLTLGLLGVLRAPISVLSVAAMALLCASVGEILFIGEVQPRYMMIALPAITILGALSAAPQTAVSRSSWAREVVWGSASVAAAILACLCAWGVSRHLLSRPWSIATTSPNGPCSTNSNWIDGNTLRVELPTGRNCAAASVTLPDGTQSLGLFITDGRYPYRFDSVPPLPLTYEIRSKDSVVEGSLDAHVVWRRLDLEEGGAAEKLDFTVRRDPTRVGEPQTLIFAYPQPD